MKKTFTFRVDETVWEKFHVIAQENDRSANNQLERLVSQFVQNYEKENEEILVDLNK